jgi:hypothetical protein
MRFLAFDILNQALKLRVPHGKCTISSLPRKAVQLGLLHLDPFGCRRFEFLNQICDSNCARQPRGYMHMIGSPTNSICFAFQIAGYGSKIGM